jgi:hypothetical protein
MDSTYFDFVVEMESKNVDPEYIQGWQGGYVCNPEREEQRLTDAYSAGYEHGLEKTTDGYADFTK